MGKGASICSAIGSVLFESQQAPDCLGSSASKSQCLAAMRLWTNPFTSLSLRCLIYKIGACVRLKGAARIRSSACFLIHYCHCYSHYAAAGSGRGSHSQTLPRGTQWPQDHSCWGSHRSHLYSDYQDLNHLQHQLKGLAALRPKLVTGTHEEVLEAAAEVFFLQRGWRGRQSPRLGPIPEVGSQEGLGLCGNGREQWEADPGRPTSPKEGRSHIPAKKEFWEISENLKTHI